MKSNKKISDINSISDLESPDEWFFKELVQLWKKLCQPRFRGVRRRAEEFWMYQSLPRTLDDRPAAAVVSSGCNECVNQGFSSRGRELWTENCNFLRRRCDLINVSLKGEVTVNTRRLQMRGEGNSMEWSTVRRWQWVVLVIWDRWLSSVCFVTERSWLASRILFQWGSWSEWRKNLSLVWPGDGGEGRREDDIA